MKKYVLAFIFDASLEKVLLIHKSRPEWQKGKINGIGGKVEDAESEIAAIVRETKEETDLIIGEEKFVHLGKMSSEEWIVEIFICIYQGSMADAKSIEDQHVEWFSVNNLPVNVLDNLRWLIPLSLTKLSNNQVKKIEVTY